MSVNDDKAKLDQLKSRIKDARKENDYRLLKLAMVMAVLAFVAAVVNGRVQIW